jgi:fumarate reductase flavoprotein subunit
MNEKGSDQKGISRRGLLKGTGVAVAAGAVGGLMPDSRAEISAARVPLADSKPPARIINLSTDICVIGGSGAGLVAAASAVESGVKDIIVLEKMKVTGGCTNVGVVGLFSVESPVQKRLGINVSTDEMFKNHMDISNWNCNAKLVRNWYTTTGSVVGWLEKKGVEFGDVESFTSERLYRTYHYAKAGWAMEGWLGKVIVAAMLKYLKENGVVVRTETRATRLLTNSNGDVTGVMATHGDEELRISAKAVIIGTGSISGNDKLKARFYPGEDMSNVRIMGNQPWATGDGLIMAEEIGAGSTHISTLYIGPHGHGTNESVGSLMRRPNLIKVNRLGYRFMDEATGVTKEYYAWMNEFALDRQPDKVCYTLIDEATLRRFQKEKKRYSLIDTMGDPDLHWLDDLNKSIPAEAEKGRIKVADTWDEIARYIGCDPDILKDTISKYNGYCENKYDAELLTDPEFLLPLTSPPYYAIQGYSGIDTCIGGLRTNHNLEVVNKKEAPIKGLYAAGVAVGNWLSIGYGPFGSCFSFVTYSGYASGKNAAKYVLSKV